MQQAVTSGGNPIPNQAKIKRAYDYIVVGSGAAGSIIAGELSKTGADILVVEAGGEDVGATVTIQAFGSTTSAGRSTGRYRSRQPRS